MKIPNIKIITLAKYLVVSLFVFISASLLINDKETIDKLQPTPEQCQTANMFFEARGESTKGMQAVASVVLHRVQHKNYPDNPCAVIFQPKQFSWTHQQSYKVINKVLKGDLSGFTAKDRQAYQQAKMIAQKPVKELLDTLPHDTLHYHASYVAPTWQKSLKKKNKLKKVGRHVFYSKI